MLRWFLPRHYAGTRSRDRCGGPTGASERGLAEETPRAYKDVTLVVEAAEGAGLCRKVARLVPLGVVKG